MNEDAALEAMDALLREVSAWDSQSRIARFQDLLGREGSSYLLTLLNRARGSLRRDILVALEDHDDQQTHASLLEIMKSSADLEEKTEIARILARNDYQPVVDYMVRFLHSPSPKLRAAGARGLRDIQAVRTKSQLVASFEAEAHPEAMQAMASALIELDEKLESLPAFLEGLTSDDGERRAVCAQAIRGLLDRHPTAATNRKINGELSNRWKSSRDDDRFRERLLESSKYLPEIRVIATERVHRRDLVILAISSLAVILLLAAAVSGALAYVWAAIVVIAPCCGIANFLWRILDTRRLRRKFNLGD